MCFFFSARLSERSLLQKNWDWSANKITHRKQPEKRSIEKNENEPRRKQTVEKMLTHYPKRSSVKRGRDEVSPSTSVHRGYPTVPWSPKKSGRSSSQSCEKRAALKNETSSSSSWPLFRESDLWTTRYKMKENKAPQEKVFVILKSLQIVQ